MVSVALHLPAASLFAFCIMLAAGPLQLHFCVNVTFLLLSYPDGHTSQH